MKIHALFTISIYSLIMSQTVFCAEQYITDKTIITTPDSNELYTRLETNGLGAFANATGIHGTYGNKTVQALTLYDLIEESIRNYMLDDSLYDVHNLRKTYQSLTPAQLQSRVFAVFLQDYKTLLDTLISKEFLKDRLAKMPPSYPVEIEHKTYKIKM